MAKILLTGIATLDIINHVDHYPTENEELRGDSQYMCRGGNASNTAVVLSQLNHHCHLAASLADDASSQFICKNLDKFNVHYYSNLITQNTITPTSFITLNTENGSRTIIHYRDLCELNFKAFDQINLSTFDWLHFEGRNIEQTSKMMNKAKQLNKTISLEAEKNRKDIDRLFPLTDVLMISKPFAKKRGFNSAKDCLLYFSQLLPHAVISCTWGNKGAWAIQSNTLFHSPAFSPNAVVDTIGAGDTFNAGLIHSVALNNPIDDSIKFACKLAGKKCGQYGFNNLGKL
jgi:ketohexokinase